MYSYLRQFLCEWTVHAFDALPQKTNSLRLKITQCIVCPRRTLKCIFICLRFCCLNKKRPGVSIPVVELPTKKAVFCFVNN